MQVFMEHFIARFSNYSLIVIVLVSFLESLALVGLILPGAVIMAGIGALISNGKINFFQAWITGVVGCLLGDWVSLWLGQHFKGSLYRCSFIKKKKSLLEKIKYALYQHSMFTILMGRFVGPTRPLVPLVAGILNLPINKFFIPNIIGCIFWPPLYFLPGIFAGAAIDLPSGREGNFFKWLLLMTFLLIWRMIWTGFRLWKKNKKSIYLMILNFSHYQLIWMVILFTITIIMLTILLRHPIMQVYRNILIKVIIH